MEIDFQDIVIEVIEHIDIRSEPIILSKDATLTITSKHIQIDNKMKIPFSEIMYHALNKEKSYVLITLSDSIHNKEIKDNKLYIYTSNIDKARSLFDIITEQLKNVSDDEDNNEDDFYDRIKIEGNTYEENDNPRELIDGLNDEYEEYNYSNTIDQIFKCEKVKNNIPMNDKRRFEDAD